jgi:hypothetical protein
MLKQALKYIIFFKIQKDQKAKKGLLFFFWEIVSRKAKWQPCTKVQFCLAFVYLK